MAGTRARLLLYGPYRDSVPSASVTTISTDVAANRSDMLEQMFRHTAPPLSEGLGIAEIAQPGVVAGLAGIPAAAVTASTASRARGGPGAEPSTSVT